MLKASAECGRGKAHSPKQLVCCRLGNSRPKENVLTLPSRALSDASISALALAAGSTSAAWVTLEATLARRAMASFSSAGTSDTAPLRGKPALAVSCHTPQCTTFSREEAIASISMELSAALEKYKRLVLNRKCCSKDAVDELRSGLNCPSLCSSVSPCPVHRKQEVVDLKFGPCLQNPIQSTSRSLYASNTPLASVPRNSCKTCRHR